MKLWREANQSTKRNKNKGRVRESEEGATAREGQTQFHSNLTFDPLTDFSVSVCVVFSFPWRRRWGSFSDFSHSSPSEWSSVGTLHFFIPIPFHVISSSFIFKPFIIIIINSTISVRFSCYSCSITLPDIHDVWWVLFCSRIITGALSQLAFIRKLEDSYGIIKLHCTLFFL